MMHAAMNQTPEQLWERFKKYYAEYPTLGLSLDISRMNFQDGFFDSMQPVMQKAFEAMAALEKSAIANPDENRMVGHYWLRNPSLAPTPAIRNEIETTVSAIKEFAPNFVAAAACDEITRKPETKTNPAALLALMWYYTGNVTVAKNMAILPHKDRFELFSRYVQQLVMSPWGKERTWMGRWSIKILRFMAIKALPNNTLIYNNLGMA